MGKKAPKAPTPPDPIATANAQGAANAEVARLNQAGSMVDQYTPYGNLIYTPIGGDRYRADVQLSPGQQQLLDIETAGNARLGQLGLDQIGRVWSAITQPFDAGSFRSAGNPDDTYKILHEHFKPHRTLAELPQVRDTSQVADLLMQRQQPQFNRQRDDIRTQMINQGIREGTEAWQRGMDDYNRQINDAQIAAQLAAGQEQSRMYDLDQQQYGTKVNDRAIALGEIDQILNRQTRERARQIEEAAYFRQLPINEAAALLSGAQVNLPQFQNVPGYNQAQTPLADSVYGSYQGQLQNYQQQMANRSNMMSGLFGLAGTGARLFFGR